jgi:hypothetical protein
MYGLTTTQGCLSIDYILSSNLCASLPIFTKLGMNFMTFEATVISYAVIFCNPNRTGGC